MPGWISWLTGMFSAAPPAERAPESRLFNPVPTPRGQASDTPDHAHQLEHHLFCWLLDTEPRALTADISAHAGVLERLGQRLRAGTLEELPRRPLGLPMLMRALSDENTGRQALTDTILQDPALTDQLLQVANSPYFRPPDHTIKSVDQAVFLLGIEGIRDVISATLMRPMMAARNSREALFARRCWLWGLACARASEIIARSRNQDASAHFMVGLLPALAYLTLRRELARLCPSGPDGRELEPALVRHAIACYQWATCQLLANEWSLPPKYHALLLTAERPAPDQPNTALSDGMLMGTREVLRNAHQRNLGEDELRALVSLGDETFAQVRKALRQILQEG